MTLAQPWAVVDKKILGQINLSVLIFAVLLAELGKLRQ